jgi:hypothetical protein
VARYLIAFSVIAVAWANGAQAQQPLRVEGIYPRQLPIGQTTVLSLVIPSVDDIQAEISPAQDVTVAKVTRGDNFQGSHTWWAIDVAVAKNAAAGDRTLTLRLPGGRSTSTSVRIPSHAPRISNLRVIGAAQHAAALDVEITAADAPAVLGEAPYVWFMALCGDMPLPGVVRGTVASNGSTGSTIRASIPRPPSPRGTAAKTCDLQIRIADAAANDSNMVRMAVEYAAFGQPAAQQSQAQSARTNATPGGSGDWAEIVSQEERLSFNIPGTPTITHVMWPSQYGAVLPARVYTVERGPSRFTATVVDYNPIERLLVERSRACPAAANTCQGIADWGIGYWKTDIRGALFYAIAKYLDRDAKMTSLIWNGIALVQGVEMRLTNNADQSRTFSSIYMHENRLVILEGTVPRGDPPPVAFNESLNWLDEQGRAVRYQATYVNIPDVPKPLPRGAPAPAPTR